MNLSCLKSGYAEGRYILPPLPYGEGALEPLICAETLYLHHDKHHAAYVAGANAALDSLQLISDGALSPSQAPALTQSLAFNLGGHILHMLYWENLMSGAGEPLPATAAALSESFGSYHAFMKIFASVALGVQGSGWAVLGVEPVSRRLMVTGMCRHHDVLVPGFCPILVCDVWEHAYYLTWSNDRKGYVNAFMQHINWGVVENRLNCIYRNEY